MTIFGTMSHPDKQSIAPGPDHENDPRGSISTSHGYNVYRTQSLWTDRSTVI
jgi:hypothetical protein